MMDIMQALEPRMEEKNVILFNELEEINEVLFFINGVHEIGYELNGVKKYIVQFKNTNPIGAFGVTFGTRSLFIYKTVTRCEGYFIRKSKWKTIMSSNEQITDEFKGQILKLHELKIKAKINAAKRKDIRRLKGLSGSG